MTNDMTNAEGGEPVPPENTGQPEATDLDQSLSKEPLPSDSVVEYGNSGISVDQSIPDRSSEIHSEDARRAEGISQVRNGLGFDNRGNFILTPATAGGVSFDEQDSKLKHVLNAQVPGRRVGPRPAGRTGGVTGRRNPFGGIKGRIAAAVTAAGLVIGGGAAYVANQSGEAAEGNTRGAPTQVVDPEKSQSSEITPTPTVEATKVPEKSPYEFSWEKKFGDVTVRIEDKLETRTECPDPTVSSKSATMVACPAMKEVVLDKENFPNAEQDLQEAAIHGFYFAWQNQDVSRKDISYEEYKTKLENGEDLSFAIRGFQGDSFLPTDIKVSPTDKVYLDWIAQPASIFRPFTSLGVGYRKINDEIHLEVYSFTAGSVNNSEKRVGATINYLQPLVYISNTEALKRGSMLPSEQDDFYKISESIGSKLIKIQKNGNISAMYAN